MSLVVQEFGISFHVLVISTEGPFRRDTPVRADLYRVDFRARERVPGVGVEDIGGDFAHVVFCADAQ